MVLEGVQVPHARPEPVGEHETVACRAEMVRRRKTIHMQSATATGGQDHRLGTNEAIAANIEREDDGAGAMAVLIAQEFDDRAAIPHGDAAVEHGFAQNPHHLKTRAITVAQDSVGRRSARAAGSEVASVVVELHAKSDEPADHIRPIHHHLRHQLLVALEMAAAQGVLEVTLRRVLRAAQRLECPLRPSRYCCRPSGASLRRAPLHRPSWR